MLKIDTFSCAATRTFTLSGDLRDEHLPELARAVNDAALAAAAVSFDLSQVGLVDRSAIAFFVSGDGRRARIVACPAYLREWLKSEGRVVEEARTR